MTKHSAQSSATYYKVIECDAPYEGGEVVAMCEAVDRESADRKLRCSRENGGNDCADLMRADELPSNVYDPRGLVK